MAADALADELEGRTIGLLGAVGIGVGAIVGGGILALAGVAFASTGPSAVVAFGLNGLIALLTALTFAEMATSFPESGGTYTFAKKVLSVEAAFVVGWVVWFASIVAAVLYALGFGTFAEIFLEQLWPVFGATPPGWFRSHALEVGLALAATAFYTWSLMRKSGGGGQWETIGKVVVFLILILGGFWALGSGEERGGLSPFFAYGGLGLVQAMGYTFIALQGFDLIAAVGGEVREPRRVLPRAIVGSLGIAMVIYVPLLLIVATVGVPAGGSITELAQADPEAVVVAAVENYLGPVGLWLVIVAALLSMLSALQANLLAASRIALTMARDRNLPARLGDLHPRRGTPLVAVLVTAVTVALILMVIPDVAAAGAVSSLIFLLSFALAHWTSILTRRRGGGRKDAFLLPFFPAIPVVGGVACLALAIFQGVVVPSAGLLGVAWLVLGGGLYFLIFSRRARVADAAAEATNPELVRLRGRAPLVLVPIANPARAEALVMLANAMTPPGVGRALLLYVVRPPDDWPPAAPPPDAAARPDAARPVAAPPDAARPVAAPPEAAPPDVEGMAEVPPQLAYAQQVLSRALVASFGADLTPELLTTVAPRPLLEIARVASIHRCESLLLGLGRFEEEAEETGGELEALLGAVDADVVLARIPDGWRLRNVRRILVPVGGRRDQSHLRARLVGSLARVAEREVVYLGIVRPSDGARASARLEREIRSLADDEAPGRSRVEIKKSDDVAGTLVERAARAELVILGLGRVGRGQRIFGDIPVRVARETESAILMISSR